MLLKLVMRNRSQYDRLNHVMNGSCAIGRGVCRAVVDERVLTGRKEKLMAVEAANGALRA